MADDSGGKLHETDIKADPSYNDLSAHKSLAAEQCHAHGQGQGQGHSQSQLTSLADGPMDNNAAMADTSNNLKADDLSGGTVGTGKARDLLDTDDTSSKGRHSSGASSEGQGAPKKSKTPAETVLDAAKQKEKEERLKHAKMRAKQEREKKIIDLKEAQKKAEEYRKKQEDDRRRKLEEIKRKEESHRNLVEERRRKLLEEDTSRKQEIIRRSIERDSKLDGIKSRRSTATPPMRAKSSHSDLAMSASSDGSPIRRPRPHSVAGRLPSYASPTVASQIRTSRSTEKKSSGNLTVCYRFRSVSPGPKLRSKSADFRRSRADIQRTFERLSTPRSKPKEPTLDTSLRTKSTPTPPRPMIPRTLPKDSSVTKPTAASQQKGVTPTKPKTPVGKESSPLRERGRSREGSATRDKPKTVHKSTPTEKASPRERPAPRERSTPREKVAPKEKPAPKESKPKPQPAKHVTKAPTPTSDKPAAKAANKTATPAKDKKDRPAKDAAASSKAAAAPSKPAAAAASKPAAAAASKPAAAKAPKAEPKPKAAAEEPVTKDKAPTTDAAGKKAEPKAENNKEEKKPSPGTSPAVTPAVGEKDAKMSEEDEYRAKLAERRRLAREKAEREAEEERKRQEELRRQEEERIRQEEEEERRQMEEAMRLAEEQRRAEEERLQRAIEAEEARKKEEQKRLEEERAAKEEAERKAAEEAEKREAERVERMKKEEEERQARKKRLEMIMKRVKTDDGSPKAQSPGSPSKSIVTPPKEMSPSEETAPAPVEEVEAPSPPQSEEDAKSLSPEEGSTPLAVSPTEERAPSPIAPASAVTPQKAAAVEDNAPKFKSPLLQQMLGKNRNRPTTIEPKAEPSEESKTVTETARNLVEDVVTKAAETLQESVPQPKLEESSVSEPTEAELVSAKEAESPVDEDKDIDTSRDLVSNEEPAGSSVETSSSSTPSQMANADSSGLVNGYDSLKDVEMEDSNEVDSSLHVNGTSEGPKTTSGADHFEELIDLSAIDNKSVHATPGGDGSTVNKFDADLINSNETTTTEKQAPLIAFEESTLKDNIQDMLS